MQIDGGDAWWLESVTWRIILSTFRVANALGHGFVEEGSVMPLPTRCESAGSALSSGRGRGHRRTQGGRRVERRPYAAATCGRRASPCVNRSTSVTPKSKSAASPPPARAQSPKPAHEHHPLHLHILFIRLQREKPTAPLHYQLPVAFEAATLHEAGITKRYI
jgi:hypothetical protein